MRKDETISILRVSDPSMGMPFSVVMPEGRALSELILLEINKPEDGSYLMRIKSAGLDVRTQSSLETSELTPDELFEAWMVMGHTIKHLVSSYKKEMIEYMVKEYRTREQLEKENEKNS